MEPRPAVRDSLKEYARGVAGGLIFALPLLYTMEMWEIGAVTGSGRLLAGLGGTFALLLAFNRFAGLSKSAKLPEVIVDSVEELGLGLVVAAGMLLLIGELDLTRAPREWLGKVLIEGYAAAIGVSVGTTQLGEERPSRDEDRGVVGEVLIALCGAVIVAGNVAPTEEILRMANGMTGWHTVGFLILALVVAAVVLQFADLRGAREFSKASPLPPLLTGPMITMAVALVASAGMLWFFGRFDEGGPDASWRQVAVLTLPASLGASAGRFLLNE